MDVSEHAKTEMERRMQRWAERYAELAETAETELRKLQAENDKLRGEVEQREANKTLDAVRLRELQRVMRERDNARAVARRILLDTTRWDTHYEYRRKLREDHPWLEESDGQD